MSNRPFSIVCAVDLAEQSFQILEHALSEARRHRAVTLHFTTIVETRKGRFATKNPDEADLKVADQALRALVSETLPAFSDSADGIERTIRFHTRAGQAAKQIVELAYEARADRIVLGRHNDQARKALGNTSAAVVNSAPCTVEVVCVADYGMIEEDYELCANCVKVRESSGGNTWFCPEHSDGRVPRLTDSIGITSPTPGWGVF